MSNKTPAKGPQAGKAEHGAQSEVTWESGKGRQPYANQDGEAGTHGGEFAEGDRGELSGRNQEQLEQVKKKPWPSASGH
jgi:hypothetical protein